MPPFEFAGELAALATSIFFSIGPTFFTLSGRLVGAALVNRTRLLAATIILMIAHTMIYGGALPWLATPTQWQWLAISGVIGLTLGDAALFQAFVQIGPRLTMLVFSLAPVLTALAGYFWLNETLTTLQLVGMGVTIVGVLWVVSEQQSETERGAADQRRGNQTARRYYYSGLAFALLGALGQGSALITAKLGLANLPVLSGQVIRMLAATLLIWAWALFRGQGRETIAKLRDKPLAARYILLGAIAGPVIGVWFSLAAVKYTEVGIASTLMALPPIFLLGIGHYFFKEKITVRAVIGTVIALSGVAILFLV
jgi:drug/metabolite transporter (DMT)-like permease